MLSGSIEPTPGADTPFKVVFGEGADVLAEWTVDSVETGERRIASALEAIASRVQAEADTTEMLREQERLAL